MKRATLIALVAMLTACASPARVDRMTIVTSGDVYTSSPLAKAFAVQPASGGGKTNPLLSSNVDAPSFEAALRNSLAALGLLADTDAAAPLRVAATIETVDRPVAGLTLETTLTVRYVVTDARGAVRLDERVAAVGAATPGDHLLATERLRIANERAVQANIGEFVRRARTALGPAPLAPTS